MPAIGKALVIGGGIGGLTAGVALRQAGIEVDLVEIQPEFSVYGVGIIQPNNVLRALDSIGLARRCCELGAAFPGWRIHDAHGNHLMDAPNGTSAAPGFPPNNGIRRPALQRVLSEGAYAQGVEIRLGTRIETFEQDDDGVDVRFSDGTSARYDLVIAADGSYSDMRKRLFPDAPPHSYTGQAVWRYNFERPKRVEWGEIHEGPRSKVGLTPLSDDLMYMFLVSPEPDNPWMPEDRLAELMRSRLEGFSGFIAELGEQITDNAGVVYKPMEVQVLPAPWYKGRIVIIGDAAHASTPHLAQGAAMAIEDAVLLAKLLGDDRAIEPLLEEFMARRFARSKYVVDTSVQIGAWELESWRGIDNPDARPGELLYQASIALQDDY